jgi:hypothetical protein
MSLLIRRGSIVSATCPSTGLDLWIGPAQLLRAQMLIEVAAIKSKMI